MLPDLNLNEILENTNDRPSSSPGHEDAKPIAKPKAVVSLTRDDRDSASPGAEETLPQQADGFDWAEETILSGLSDGMAALAIKPEGTGYLGQWLPYVCLDVTHHY